MAHFRNAPIPLRSNFEPNNTSTIPLAPVLTNEENAVILAHHVHGMSQSEIASELNRSRDTIQRFLKKPNKVKTKPWKPRNQKLSGADKRRIIREAQKTKHGAARIRDDLGLDISVRRVQQVLKTVGFLAYMRAPRAPYLTATHKKNHLSFSRDHLQWGHVNWRKVIFTEEKKFNLDGPDGLNYYWHDLRTTTEIHSKRQQGGDSVMLWGCISYYGKGDLVGIEGNQNSKVYCSILEEGLLPFAAENLGENWVLQQDGASNHRSNHTKKWLADHSVDVLDWPAKSLDLNIIENVWGLMARRVYEDGKQSENIDQLGNAIVNAWNSIGEQYIKNLYKSIPNRLINVIELKGNTTKY